MRAKVGVQVVYVKRRRNAKFGCHQLKLRFSICCWKVRLLLCCLQEPHFILKI